MITTERLMMRPLTVDDATERYLGWFGGAGASRLTATKYTKDISDLRAYIEARISREDVLFLGLFERQNGLHIGNLKYEPILPDGSAILGIFVGDESARGKGYAGEAIAAANRWLWNAKKVQRVFLGVEANNFRAIRAYEKLGFARNKSPLIPESSAIHCMSIQLQC